MISYTTLGSNNIEVARAFYTNLFSEIGGREMFDNGRLYFYGIDPASPMIAIGGPYDEQAATVGNGVMIAINAGDEETVGKLHAKGVELGGTCDGEPGQRVPGFYGAYVRDPDGNKLCFCKLG